MQTTGVLLFTNDGELAKKLTHPSYEKEKIYHVQLDNDIAPDDLKKIKAGFELEDGFIAADDIQLIDPTDGRQVGIEIHSGKNRIVRRIFNHLGYNVVKLDRVMFAGLTKKDLPRGRYRFLTQQEINFLKMS
jgi:23S rRNA pseudouridine2605 synthase